MFPADGPVELLTPQSHFMQYFSLAYKCLPTAPSCMVAAGSSEPERLAWVKPERNVTFYIPQCWRRRCGIHEKYPTTTMSPHRLDLMNHIPDPDEYFQELREQIPASEAKARDVALKLHMELWFDEALHKDASTFSRSFFVIGQTGPVDKREYLLDSGASCHLISWQYLRLEEKRTYRRTDEPTTL